MQSQTEDGKSKDPNGNYIVLNGKRRELIHHPTDFAIMKECPVVQQQIAGYPNAAVQQLAIGKCRVTVADPDPQKRNELMDEIRQQDVAHHIYLIEGTSDEIVLTDQIFLTMENDDPAQLTAIRDQYHLVPDGQRGKAYVFKVTEESKANPLKIANEITNRYKGVKCIPKILVPIQVSSAPAAGVPDLPALIHQHELVAQQWHLSARLIDPADSTIKTTASVNAFEAWALANSFGKSEIVIAVIDDSFDLPTGVPIHPAFRGKVISPQEFNFVEGNHNPSQGQEKHGTPVASLATACNQILGVAPGCTLLPIRMGLSPMIDPDVLLAAFTLASKYADVVNCSFQHKPATANYLLDHPTFMSDVAAMIENGGRRGRGLVIVVASGDYDAPISLTEAENKNGVKFINSKGEADQVPAGQEVHTSFPEIRDVVVVGAMSSLMRKSGYSNWGHEVTVVAPSDNYHDIARATAVDEQFKKDFIAANGFPGGKMLAAARRGGVNNVLTPLNEFLFTDKFGGTSAAAPIVTGVVALMLSAKKELHAKKVIEILKTSADKVVQGLDVNLDLPADPNMQGKFKGDFNVDTGRSLFFGAGKVNALEAVRKAMATPPGEA